MDAFAHAPEIRTKRGTVSRTAFRRQAAPDCSNSVCRFKVLRVHRPVLSGGKSPDALDDSAELGRRNEMVAPDRRGFFVFASQESCALGRGG